MECDESLIAPPRTSTYPVPGTHIRPEIIPQEQEHKEGHATFRPANNAWLAVLRKIGKPSRPTRPEKR